MQLDLHATRIRTICLCILAAIASGWVLAVLHTVLVPFALALLLAITVSPLVDALVVQARVPRGIATVFTLAIGLLVLLAVGWYVALSVQQLIDQWPTYYDRMIALERRLEDSLGLEADVLAQYRHEVYGAIPRLVANTTSALLGIVSNGFVVLIYVAFLLATPARRFGSTWLEIRYNIRRYIGLKVFISLVTAIAVGGVLAWLEVGLAPLFALLVFLLNFIPNVGPPIATLLPLPVVLVSPDLTTTQGVLAIAVPAGIQFVLGNVVEPRMMGRSLDLHPVAVLVALIFWGVIWGIVGIFLAVPMTVAIKIVLERLEFTAPVADLLAEHGRYDFDAPRRVATEAPEPSPSAGDGEP